MIDVLSDCIRLGSAGDGEMAPRTGAASGVGRVEGSRQSAELKLATVVKPASEAGHDMIRQTLHHESWAIRAQSRASIEHVTVFL